MRYTNALAAKAAIIWMSLTGTTFPKQAPVTILIIVILVLEVVESPIILVTSYPVQVMGTCMLKLYHETTKTVFYFGFGMLDLNMHVKISLESLPVPYKLVPIM